jgi:hypothetical protein
MKRLFNRQDNRKGGWCSASADAAPLLTLATAAASASARAFAAASMIWRRRSSAPPGADVAVRCVWNFRDRF